MAPERRFSGGVAAPFWLLQARVDVCRKCVWLSNDVCWFAGL